MAKTISTILNLKDNMSGGLSKIAKKTEGVSKEMASATRTVESWGKKAGSAITSVAKKATALGAAAVTTAATGLGAMAVKAGVAADDLNTLSKQSGFSTEDIQKWQYASDLVDVSVDDIVSSAKKMKKNMASTSSSTVEAWSAIGVATRDANGELRDSSTVFYEALEGLSKIENDTERDTLAMTLFGKSADSLAGIVDDGGQALKELGDQAESLGLILGQDALDSANAFNDVIDTMKAKASASFTKIGNAAASGFLPVMEKLAPVAEKLADGAVSLLSDKIETLGSKLQQMADDGTLDALATKLVDGVGKAIDTVSSAAQWAIDHGDTIKRVVVGFSSALAMVKLANFASQVLSTIKTVKLFASTVGAIVAANPVVLGIAAAVAAGALLIANWDKVKAFGSTLCSTISDKFVAAKDSIVGAFSSIKSAASRVFTKIGNAASSGFLPVMEKLADGAVTRLSDKIETLGNKLQQMADDGTLDALATKLVDGVGKAIDTVSSAAQWAIDHGDTIKRVVVGFGSALAMVKLASFASQVLSVIKTVKLFVTTAGAIVAANPVVLGIAAAVAAGALLIANWDKVKAFGSALCATISEKFAAAKDAIVGAFTAVKTKVSSVFTWIGSKLSWLDEKISGVPVIGSIYSGLKGGVSFLVSGASSLLSGASGSVKGRTNSGEGQSNSAASTYVSGHATGTSFFSGGLTRVNERGGEIINLPSGSQIIPHDVSKAAVGGNTITVNVTVQGNVIDDGDYADRLGNTIAQRILAALENV